MTRSWNRTSEARSYVTDACDLPQLHERICGARDRGLSISIRGAGMSYGDQALNTENLQIDLDRMNRILSWNGGRGILRAEPGVTMGAALNRVMMDGWILPVVPGSQFITVGGAAGNNVHGKNAARAGTFGECIRRFTLLLASGETIECSPARNSEIFFAAIGGAGLLGPMVELEIQCVRPGGSALEVGISAARNVEEVVDRVAEAHAEDDYVFAQIDGFAHGPRTGRGTVHRAKWAIQHAADHKMKNGSAAIGVDSRPLPSSITNIVSRFVGMGTIQRVTEAKFKWDSHRGGRTRRLSFDRFTFMLDRVPEYWRIYPHGFMHHHSLVAWNSAAETFRALLELARNRSIPPWLTSIKAHRADEFLLSFALDGCSLLMDIPFQSPDGGQTRALLTEMNEIVERSGGLVYLAKDQTLDSRSFGSMYPGVHRLIELKRRLDPQEAFQSDMYRRLYAPLASP